MFGGGAGFNQGAGLGFDPGAGFGLGASLFNLSTQMGEFGLGRCGLRLGRLLGETTKAAALLLSSLGLGA